MIHKAVCTPLILAYFATSYLGSAHASAALRLGPLAEASELDLIER